MKVTILSLRVNRRAIGAALLTNEGLTLADSRHLASRSHQAVPTAVRYVERLLTAPDLTAVIVDTSAPELSPVTGAIFSAIKQLCVEKGLPPLVVRRGDMLAAYGVPALRNRKEIRSLITDYWPTLSSMVGRVKPFAIDAAAAALYAECLVALSPTPT